MATPSWIQHNEKVVGENHPSLADVANRPAKIIHANFLIEHNSDGSHKILPAGTKMWFYQNTAPPGWTIDAVPADAVLAVKGGENAYNVAGGQQAGTWIQPSHMHTGPNHTHDQGTLCALTVALASFLYQHRVAQAWSTEQRSQLSGSEPYVSDKTQAVDVIGSTGAGGTGQTGAEATAATYRPLAQIGIIAVKD